MYKGNYHKIKFDSGIAIYTSKLGNKKIIDTTPPWAMNEFERELQDLNKLIDTNQESIPEEENNDT